MRNTTHSPPSFRWLRVALTSAFWLQGTFAFWSPPVVHAQNPDSIVAGVTPISTKPPGAVADLLASANPSVQGQISLTWSAPQGNAGGTPINNQKVDHYTIGYATYSVDSLSGDTTAWWISSGVTQTVLGPPGYTPQSPGSLEADTFTGLLPGVTYYFALRSTSLGGIESPIDTESATPGEQAHALSTSLVSQPPASFMGTGLSPTSIEWTWPLASGAAQYLIYSQPGNILLQTLSNPTTYWIETNLSTNTVESRIIYSSSTYGISGSGTNASRATFALIPTSLTVTGVSYTTAHLTWSDDGNPTGTSYSLEDSLDATTFSALTPTTSTSTTDSGLLSNTTYFYRVQSLNADGVGSGYSAIVSTMTIPTQQTPAMPNGLTVAVDANTFSFQWHAVQEDVNGQPITITQYRVDRYADISSTGPNQSAYVPTSQLSFSEPTGRTVQFYRVVALGFGGTPSAPSDFCDSSIAANRYAIAPDDLDTRVVMPAAIANELRKENNIYGEDLEIKLARRAQDEDGTTLRSYDMGAYIARTGGEVFNFAFSKPAISVQMGYGAVLGTVSIPTNAPGFRSTSRASAGSIAQIISIYWNNGQNFIRVSDPVLTSNQALSIQVRSLGVYQIRATLIASHFQLAQGSPYPRIITPNGAENRKVFFFFDNPDGDPVAGAIYDIHGANVRNLQVDGNSPTTTSIVWDGHDSGGAVVPSGVYLYKITAGDQKATGTLVVAR